MRRFWNIVCEEIPDAAAAVPKMVLKFTNADLSKVSTTIDLTKVEV